MTALVVTQHRFPTHATTVATLTHAFNEQGTQQLSEPGSGAITLPRDTLVRVVTDGVRTNADATVTSATAVFSSHDVGLPIAGTGIPAGTTVASINSATSVEMSANATSSASGATLNIGYDLRINDLLRYKIDGTVRHASIVERLEDHTLDVEGGSRQVTTASGRDVNMLPEWGIIGPANGFEARPKEQTRVFNVYAMEYDISAWDAAVESGVAAIPAEWPTAGGPYGPYISTVSATGTTSPNGPSLVGIDFTVPSDVEATLFCSADNWARVWIDGQPMLEVGGIDQSNSYLRTFTARVSLSTGVTHRVMIRFFNKGGDNPGGVRFLLAETDTAGVVTDVLLESSDSWKSLETPSPWPGMTATQAVRIALEDIQARGRLTWLNTDFSDGEDSAGAPLTEVGDISTKTGNSLLAFLTELSASYIDWVIDPDTLTLSLYIKDTYAQVGGSAVTLEPAAVTADGNVVQLDRVLT